MVNFYTRVNKMVKNIIWEIFLVGTYVKPCGHRIYLMKTQLNLSACRRSSKDAEFLRNYKVNFKKISSY